MKRFAVVLAVLAFVSVARPAPAQALSGKALVKALQRGGYVLVMRHASSPNDPPAKEAANADNVNRERQLDDQGRDTATEMGKALQRLKIPVGDVFSSPAYRAMETARLAQLPHPQVRAELGNAAQAMQQVSDDQASWLKSKVVQFVKGSNTIIITHVPMIVAAFPQWSTGLTDGEALVIGPDAKGEARLVARIKIESWPSLRP